MVELWTCCRCFNISNADLSNDRCAVCGHSRCYTCLFPGQEPNRTREARPTPREISSPRVPRPSYPTNVKAFNPRHASVESDDDSISDRESVFSYGYSQTSQTTIGSTEMQDSLVREVVRILSVDDLLIPLRREALRNPGNGRLQNNVRRLLVKYAHDMKREPNPNLREYRAIAQFVGRFAGRISSEICLLVSGERGESFERLQSLRTSKQDRLKIEGLLKGTREYFSRRDGLLDSDDDVSEPEDDGYDYDDDTTFPEISRAEKYLLRSAAFQSLVARLNEWVSPSFQARVRKLLDLLPEPDGDEASVQLRHELCQVVTEIQSIPPSSITSYKYKRVGLLNYFKGLVERWSGEKWDWRPLTPYMRPLSHGEVRVFWTCTCGETRWAEVPVTFADKLSRIIKKSTMDAGEEAHGTQQSVQNQASSSSSRRDGTSQEAKSRTASSNKGENTLERGLHGPESEYIPRMPSAMPALRYVLLLVTAGNSNRLSQIEVHRIDNNQFFQLLRSEYRRLRGTLRSMLSVWRYSHCDFYQCEKFDDSEYTIRKKDEYPDTNNADYDYNPKPMHGIPPISAHEFYKRFHACYRPDPWSVHLFHRCKKASCHSSEVLDMLPKKKTELEEGGDQRETFWGIYAREMPCFRVVVVYNVVCILPLLVFFFLWLFPLGHGAALESAAVPLSIMLGMLSLFWSVFLGSLHGGRAGIMA